MAGTPANPPSTTAPASAPITAAAPNQYVPASLQAAAAYHTDFLLLDVWAKLKTDGAVYADQTWVGYVGETVPDDGVVFFNR